MHETGDEDHQRRGADLNINIRTPKNKEYRQKKKKKNQKTTHIYQVDFVGCSTSGR